jgi:hypothetical protein
MRVLLLAAGFAVALLCAPVRAAVIQRSENIHQLYVQGDLVWLYMSGAWGSNCGQNWVWFNRQTHPHYLAVALAARLDERSVTITADDALPMAQGYCQVVAVII